MPQLQEYVRTDTVTTTVLSVGPSEGAPDAPTYQELDPSLLKVDPSYQRSLSPSRVKALISEFERDSFGIIVVSMRDDNGLYVVDGQHRVLVWQKVRPTQNVPCLVHIGLSPEREARMFKKVNGRRARPTPLDLFRADLRAGEPTALAILALLRKYGLEVGWDRKGAEDNQVVAVNALQECYGDDGGQLDDVLRILWTAWHGKESSFTSQFILGMDRFIRRYKDEYKETRLIERLQTVTPSEVRDTLRGMRLLTGDGRLAFALTLAKIYNHQRRSNARLSSWEKEIGYGERNSQHVARNRSGHTHVIVAAPDDDGDEE